MGLVNYLKKRKTEKEIHNNATTEYVSTQSKIIFRDKADQLARQIESEINKQTKLTPPQKEHLMQCASRLRAIGGKIKNEKRCNQIMDIIAGELINLDVIIQSDSLYGVKTFINRIDQLISDFVNGNSEFLNPEMYDRYLKKKKLEDRLYAYERKINSENLSIKQLLVEGDYANTQNDHKRILEIKNEISLHDAKILEYRDQRDKIRDEIQAIDSLDDISEQLETDIEITNMSEDVYQKMHDKLDSLEKLGMLNAERKEALVERLENHYAQSSQNSKGFQSAIKRGSASREDAQQEKIETDANLLNPGTDENWEEFKKKRKGSI